MKLRSFIAILVSALVASAFPARAQIGDILLNIMASPAGFAAGASPGHAFFCIALIVRGGLKEDCYGFYPKGLSAVFVGGPGVVESEFQKNPRRFSIIAASVMDKITEGQRRQILTAVEEFNHANYQFTDANCIDFLDRIVQLAGWQKPPRSPTQTPVEYVNAVGKFKDTPGCTASGCPHR